MCRPNEYSAMVWSEFCVVMEWKEEKSSLEIARVPLHIVHHSSVASLILTFALTFKWF